jgi:hypothetical protein
MRPSEIETFIRWARFPYVLRRSLTTSQIAAYAKRGPVLVGHVYGQTPEWEGYVYAGVKADGLPNGFADPKGKAGKNQLAGFENGRHMGVLLGTVDAFHCYWFDPNHDSSARPERVPYDVMTSKQLDRLVQSYPGGSYVFIPTREV